MTASTRTLPDATGVGRTALRVADLDGTVEFYRDVVGLDVLTRDGSGATLGAGGTALLVLVADADAPPRDRRATGLYHNAFRVPSRGALADALARVRERWHLDGASDHDVSEALYLSDPEGNGVELYRDRPRDQWPGPDGEIRMGTTRLDLEDLVREASEDGGDAAAPPGTTVGHVHLEVSSTAAAREFYADTVGFDVTVDMAPQALFLSAGGYHHHLGANTWQGRSDPAGGRGLAWFEIVVPGEAAFDALRTRLADADVPTAGVDDGLEVTDPDGITVRFRAEE